MPVAIRVRDARANNTLTVEHSLAYDTTPPVLHHGTMQIQAIPNHPSIIMRLHFTNLNVTDNLYPSRGFWGCG